MAECQESRAQVMRLLFGLHLLLAGRTGENPQIYIRPEQYHAYS